jgi:two-component system chemotaxis family response regulator WspR
MQLRRRGDTVARIGGEEFGVILPETDLAEAVRVAERLREGIAALRFDPGFRDTEPYAVTMSFGAAVAAPDLPDSGQVLHEQADLAMYAAKQGGRNRVATPVAAAPSGALGPRRATAA